MNKQTDKWINETQQTFWRTWLRLKDHNKRQAYAAKKFIRNLHFIMIVNSQLTALATSAY